MKTRLLSIVIILGLALGFFTCNKTILTTPTALRVVNVYPGSAAQDMYLDGTLQTPAGIAYGLKDYNYSIQPGTYNFKIAPTGTTTYNTDDNIDFGAGKNYLMFLLHVGDTLQPEAAEVVLPTLGFDTSGIRFFDFIPNSKAMDIAFHAESYYNTNVFYFDTTYKVYTNRYYNDQYSLPTYKNFYRLPAGQYNFKMRYAGTANVVDSMELSLAPGKSYTIYARGFMDSSGVPPVIIDTIVH